MAHNPTPPSPLWGGRWSGSWARGPIEHHSVPSCGRDTFESSLVAASQTSPCEFQGRDTCVSPPGAHPSPHLVHRPSSLVTTPNARVDLLHGEQLPGRAGSPRGTRTRGSGQVGASDLDRHVGGVALGAQGFAQPLGGRGQLIGSGVAVGVGEGQLGLAPGRDHADAGAAHRSPR